MRVVVVEETGAPFTLAHVSDFHAGSPYFVPNLMDHAIVELNELNPTS